MVMARVVLLCVALGVALAAPLQPEAPVPNSLGNVDLGLTVFDQSVAKDADYNKDYIIFAYDKDSCAGDKAAQCEALEKALNEAVGQSPDTSAFTKYQQHLVFGKANKDDFPDHKKDFEKAKVPLPAVLFWPAGHTRPSCKFDTPNPSPQMVSDWLLSKLKDEEDDDLLQLDEGDVADATPSQDVSKDAQSALVCQANAKDAQGNVVPTDVACSDLMEGQNMMQVEKTEKVWDFKTADTKFIGAADNSLPHEVKKQEGPVRSLDATSFHDLSQEGGKYTAMLFTTSWCHYCECLEPVWNGVAGNLVSTNRQPNLVIGSVDGDANPELRALFGVEVYPTFLVINKEGNKVLGRYLGPRKVFELSNWVEDLIVADENPVVKQKFTANQQGEHTDVNPVFPYKGEAAYPASKLALQALASLEATVQLTGNDFDECLETDAKKFMAPGAALLVHYGNADRSLEMDGEVISVGKVADKLTVIDFYAPWCPHCQKLNPTWEKIHTDLAAEGISVGKIDMEAHPEVKQQFGIHRFPTIMYFEAGQPMQYQESHRYTGQRDVQHLESWIRSLHK